MPVPEKQELDIPTAAATTTTTTTAAATQDLNKCDPSTNSTMMFTDEYDIDSSCSTPYVSAPSSPGRGGGHGEPPITGFYYSAPASPMHFMLSSASAAMSNNTATSSNTFEVSSSTSCSFEFDFSATKISTNGTSSAAGSMSSADELFLNGQIRPMKLSSHLQRPQVLAPLLDLDEEADEQVVDEVVIRGRGDAKMRDRSLRRRTRSMSPLRTTTPFDDFEPGRSDGVFEDKKKLASDDQHEGEEALPCESESGASSRSSSVGRSSMSRWVFLKEFLYRSKSEGRNNGHKFWGSLSFSPVKDKIKMEKLMMNSSSKEKTSPTTAATTVSSDLPATESAAKAKQTGPKDVKKKAMNGVGKRRVPPSPHELHYTANRAQAEEMRKKTFLPYRQGLLGCLGFSSKSYGAMNGFARALNPVSSR